LYLANYVPERSNWHLSVMDPGMQWKLLPVAIGLGGHVRVGWEDNPYLPDGTASRSNAELVEVVVRMAESMGRPIASPQTARAIIGLRG
jgi:3-keto-5-aminohexanoate cleavage enzyme